MGFLFKGVAKKALLQDLNDISPQLSRNDRLRPNNGMQRTRFARR
jgi:hypothetical protein